MKRSVGLSQSSADAGADTGVGIHLSAARINGSSDHDVDDGKVCVVRGASIRKPPCFRRPWHHRDQNPAHMVEAVTSLNRNSVQPAPQLDFILPGTDVDALGPLVMYQ